ncbi:hypothetical protein CCACVL1_06522 [Corchorus capsularis]|uniref:RNA polymerase II C-terminal domain phosphatase-like n=1 Tax=Corchorus capsularis TaxID=210143 RepID=A0A1R3JEY3_COCAP|nr:hypothetical protein CCACVL1_06522 [Corchorus capsularis]
MSLVTESPLHSPPTSSDDDFAALLDAELEVDSSSSSPNEEEDYDNSQRNKRRKTQKLEDPEELCKKDKCRHPGSFGKMCIICGEKLGIEESGVNFGYVHKNLRLGNDEIVRLRSADMKNLLRNKKLCLVLDLDHTLLNSTELIDLTPEEEYLKAQSESDSSLFMVESLDMMTKLRPFVHEFLKETREMFEMYIYTMGDRAYALEMAKLLDPESDPKGDYFNGRVISRDDGTQKNQKGLDVIPGQESAVVILDDTESLKTDETEHNGALASVLEALKRIHHMFFEQLDDNLDVGSRDVRQVMKTVRKEVLQGCKIVFSRVFPIEFPAETHVLWKMAEELGATCSREIDASVTHVVSKDARTEKSYWAVKEHKLLVHPRWIEAANFLWQKQPEENFPVERGQAVNLEEPSLTNEGSPQIPLAAMV